MTLDSTDVRGAAEAMTGPEALPIADDGDVVFTEPWQGRAVAVAIETVAAAGGDWERFRSRLIAAIGEAPERAYYDSWLVALERLATDLELTSSVAIDEHRHHVAAYRTSEQEPGDLEVFPIPVDEDTLLDVLGHLFTEHWPAIRFGTVIQGAVYEWRARSAPRLTMLDGYLTVDLGDQHLHLCIGEHHGVGSPVSPELARRRRTAHAELQRQWVDGAPRTWMVRLFNGDGEQQLTVLLPNPFLDDEQHHLEEPDWGRLAAWDELRARHLDLAADPTDRLGDRFVHA